MPDSKPVSAREFLNRNFMAPPLAVCNWSWSLPSFQFLQQSPSKDPDNLPTVSYDYDLANRILHVSKPVVGGDPSSGELDFTWDAAGRLLMEEYPDGKQVQYEVDENGNVTKLTYPDSYYVERYFDELNRLTGIMLRGKYLCRLRFKYLCH